MACFFGDVFASFLSFFFSCFAFFLVDDEKGEIVDSFFEGSVFVC